MSDFSCLVDRAVKVTHGADTRRGKLSVPAKATSADAFAAIQATVAQLFETSVECLWLKYVDDEGDWCTLTENSVADMIALTPEGILRLTLEIRKLDTAPPLTSSVTVPMDIDRPDASTAGAEVSASAVDCSEAPGDDALRLKIRTFLQKIPVGAHAIASGFLQGMDPAGIHGLVQMAAFHKATLAAQSSNIDPSMQQHVRDLDDVLPQLLQMDPGALKALILSELQHVATANNATGGTNPGGGQPPNDLEAMLGSFLGGGNIQGNGQPNPLGQLIGTALAGKGIGKGAATPLQTGPGTCPFENAFQTPGGDGQMSNPMLSMLGQLFNAKGAGKGNGSWPCGPSPMNNLPTPTPDHPYVQPSQDAPPASDADSGSRAAFDESVEDLVSMGLVADRQVARELLTKHGDISTVVSILTEE